MKPLRVLLALALLLAAAACDEFQSPTEPPGSWNWVEIELSIRGEPTPVERAHVQVRDVMTEEGSGDLITDQNGLAGPRPWNTKLEQALVSASCGSCRTNFDPVSAVFIRPVCREESDFGTVCKIVLQVDRR